MKSYYENAYGRLYHGDCLDIMPNLGVKVDAVITDPPYGTTACKWDSIIPFEQMWSCLNTICKDNGAKVLFGSEPFSSALRMSNIKQYKYDWVWIKERGTGFARSKKQPLRKNECISIFYNKQPYYNYVGEKLDKPYKHALPVSKSDSDCIQGSGYIDGQRIYVWYTHATKHNILTFSRATKAGLHPTQKPVALLEYLIKTYTNANELVLDFTAGSGTAGVAAINTGRRFILIEKEEKYCEIAAKRLEDTLAEINKWGDL